MRLSEFALKLLFGLLALAPVLAVCLIGGE